MFIKLTQEEFIQKVKTKYGDKYDVIGNYVKTDVPIKIRHSKCGTIFDRTPNSILSKGQTFCPLCDGYPSAKALVGINDLWTVAPNIAEILTDPNDGYIYTISSGRKAHFTCPNCGGINYKTISQVVSRGLCCTYCNKGKSYPNKIMANILKILNVDFIPEYCIKPYKYRYDFYFEFNNKKYIVEMDGGIGHGNITFDGKDDINGKINDINKDLVCAEHDITMIRIDSNYRSCNRKIYILNNILSSQLADIFDLNNIDFDTIDHISSRSTVVEVAELWNSGIHSYKSMSEILKLNRSTLRKHVMKCCEIGLIKDDYETVKKEIQHTRGKKRSEVTNIHVMCNETGIAYRTISDARRDCHASNIFKFFRNEVDFAGHLQDGTKLTWVVLNEEEYQQYLANQKESI